MIYLRNFTEADLNVLQKYTAQTMEQLQNLIKIWETKSHNGKYFEMFAIMNDEEIVGSISLYQHSDSSVECGPEIWEDFRNNGYGCEATKIALELAKCKGFKIAQAQILTDNFASIALHKKLGFETDSYVYVNAKGKSCYIFLKSLV